MTISPTPRRSRLHGRSSLTRLGCHDSHSSPSGLADRSQPRTIERCCRICVAVRVDLLPSLYDQSLLFAALSYFSKGDRFDVLTFVDTE